jgi:alkane 1-monooxygenase
MDQPAYSPPIMHSSSRWLGQKRYWYLLNPFLVLTPLFSSLLALYSNNGLWLWATVPFMYVLMPLLDVLVGQDPANPSDAEVDTLRDDPYYVNVLYLATAMHWVTLLGTAWIVGSGDWHWLNIVGAGMSVGCMNGAGLATGHELGHKVSDPKQSWGAKIMVACCGYAHFMIEHNKGHHKDVSTPEDPASSRFGESIYKFVLREIPGAARRAWKLESERLTRLGLPFWSRQNEILQSLAITVLAYAAILAIWGVKMLPFLALSVIYGWWTLTCANYVEHYGLLRQKEASGRYERCAPHHSWNSNFKLSNLALLHLQRHSDHHAHPTRPYQVLRDMDNVPQLPGGYPGMFVLAMWPMAWFAVMDKRVLAWASGDLNKINIDPDRRDEMFRRYQQSAM